MTPRLRYKKTGNPLYEQPPDISGISQTDDEGETFSEDGSNSGSSESLYFNPPTPAKGWWSTQEIVRSLSELKIRQTIENYRQAISILENELISRHVQATDNRRIYSKMVIQETRSYIRRSNRPSGTSRRCLLGILKKRSLSEEQRQEILDKWLELVEQYKESL